MLLWSLYALRLAVARVEEKVDRILAKEIRMAKTLDDVLADVTAQTTVVQSVLTLIEGLKQQLADALASGDPAKVQAVLDGLEANTASLSAAVTANTPAPPTP